MKRDYLHMIVATLVAVLYFVFRHRTGWIGFSYIDSFLIASGISSWVMTVLNAIDN